MNLAGNTCKTHIYLAQYWMDPPVARMNSSTLSIMVVILKVQGGMLLIITRKTTQQCVTKLTIQKRNLNGGQNVDGCSMGKVNVLKIEVSMQCEAVEFFI